MSFLFDKLFQKQNPALASQMAQRGLVFDKNRHRWVKRSEHKDAKETKSSSFNPSPNHEYMQDVTTRKAVKTLETQFRGDITPEKAAREAGNLWQNMESARKEFKTKQDFQRSVAILTDSNERGVPHYKYWDDHDEGTPGVKTETNTPLKLDGVQSLHQDEWYNLSGRNKLTDREGKFGEKGAKYTQHIDPANGKTVLQEVNLTNEEGYKIKTDRSAKYNKVGNLVEDAKQALWEDLYSSQPTSNITKGMGQIKMTFLFDKLFQKQNPELASEMAKRGLIFDRIRHRWVKNPANRAQPKTAPQKTSKPITFDELVSTVFYDNNHELNQVLAEKFGSYDEEIGSFAYSPSKKELRNHLSQLLKPQSKHGPSQVETSQDFIWDGSEVQPVHSELDSDNSREMNFQKVLKHSRGGNKYLRYIDAYKQIYGNEQRYSWVQLHSKLSNKEKHARNSEKEQKGFATENWRWSKDPTKKRLDQVEIGFLNALTQENDHAGAMEHIAQFLGDKHLANRASKNRRMRDERRTSTDDKRWSKFNRRVLAEISAATNERIQNIPEVNRAM